MKINVAAISHIGKLKKSNQDRILVRVGERNDQEFGLFVIADGMGGLSCGERAAEIAVVESERWWESDLRVLMEQNKLSIENIMTTLTALIFEIHTLIQAESKVLCKTLGTTTSILFLWNNRFFSFHVGDTRIYKIDKKIVRITEDHTWVQKEVDAGRLTNERAKVHKNRNVLVQCMGMEGEPEVNISEGKLYNGDSFLLMSDGFYHYMEESKFWGIRRNNEEELYNWLKFSVNEILSQKAHDNLTAIAIST